MLNQQLGLGVSLALFLTLFAGSSVAQQPSPAPASQPGVQCGGQYECLEYLPLTPAEAQASRSHPQNAQPQELAATNPTVARPSTDEKREGTSPP
jgi:hypothetical protein